MGDIWDEVEIEENDPIGTDSEYISDDDGIDFSSLPHGPAVLMPKPRSPKGNTKWYMRGEARQGAADEATGQAHHEPDVWRDQLRGRERSKAISSLTDESHTHCSDSGFGLA